MKKGYSYEELKEIANKKVDPSRDKMPDGPVKRCQILFGKALKK